MKAFKKLYFCILLTAVLAGLSVLSTACSDGEEDKADLDAIKILAIGNSFSMDSVEWLHDIASGFGYTDITIGHLYIGGCDLTTHAIHAKYDTHNYTYRKNTQGAWLETFNASMSEGVADEPWDFITLQQVSGDSGKPDTYNEDIDEIIGRISTSATTDSYKLLWNMTWAYQSDSTHLSFAYYSNDQQTMYNAIIGAVNEKILTNPVFYGVIPTGTAIQNVRTSVIGDALTRDGYHLSLAYGRYIAGLTWFAAITGNSVADISFAPALTGEPVITEEMKRIAKESVANAIAAPYTVTPSY